MQEVFLSKYLSSIRCVLVKTSELLANEGVLLGKPKIVKSTARYKCWREEAGLIKCAFFLSVASLLHE